MVDRCDALIALWDGEDPRGQGGTAEIVAYAQENGVPIAWVNTQGNPEPTYAHSYKQDSRAKVLTPAAGKLRTYNARVIDRAQFDQRIQDLRDELMPDVAREIPIDPLGLSREKVADWVFPYFVRADILALRYQRNSRRLNSAIFALTALAVAVVAIQATLWPGRNWVAVFVVICLVSVLFILRLGPRLRPQDQWISCRFLAERLRSSYFLALAGTGDHRGRPARIAYLFDSSEAWIERALTEVIACRPQLDAGSAPVEVLRDYLNRLLDRKPDLLPAKGQHKAAHVRWPADPGDRIAVLADPDRPDHQYRGVDLSRLSRRGRLGECSRGGCYHRARGWRSFPRAHYPAPVPPLL